MKHRHSWTAARAAFVVAALGFAWWGFQGRWDDIQRTLLDVPPLGLVAALVATCLGLLVTAVVWQTILAGYGARVSAVESAAIFFVGQLGKYIPGSVWSIGAQAQAAARLGVAPRTTAACSLVFLFVHVVSGVVPTTLLVLLGVLPRPGPLVLWCLACVGALALLAPWTIARLGRLLAAQALVLTPRAWIRMTSSMACVWLLYGVAVAAIARSSGHFWLLLGSFAAAYVVGVVIVFAPAGLGAREGTLIALLAPVFGVGAAAAVALVIRLIHTAADVLMAVGSSWIRRHRASGGAADTPGNA